VGRRCRGQSRGTQKSPPTTPAIRDRFGVTLVGIQRMEGHFEHATPDSQVQDGNILFVAGPSGHIEKFTGYSDAKGDKGA
jgi:Trk K+ transport system NAD-binding subunit